MKTTMMGSSASKEALEKAYKFGYKQALVDVWTELELVDKNIRNGRYIITSEQMFRLEK